MSEDWVIAALYQFCSVSHLHQKKETLLHLCKQENIFGTLILAEEGINGTIAGSRSGIDKIHNLLISWKFNNLEYKESFAKRNNKVFYRMKIKIKSEIVTMRIPNINPNLQRAEYLSPRDWHNLIKDPNVVILDTRNDYEYRIGTFRNAINPKISYFVDFPTFCESHREQWKDKVIAMFCTGGIRCEKSTSFATTTNLGKKVYHLKGGILKYLEEIPKKEGLWDGECFVFDYRVSVGYGLIPGEYKVCYTCRMPLTSEEFTSPLYIIGSSCPYCYHQLSDKQKMRFAERQKQLTLGSCSF